MNSMAESAQACLSLAYKYDNLLSCVQDQRPILLNDAELQFIEMQIKTLHTAFKERVKQLANYAD